MGTIDKSIVFGCRKWFRDTQHPNPAWRNLTLATASLTLPRTRTGTENPKHKQMIQAGLNATTILSGTFTSLEARRCDVHLKFVDTNGNIQTQEAWGDLLPIDTSLPEYNGSWQSQAASRASAKYHKAVREAQVRMSGPTFLGELRETLRMLKKPGAALQDGVRKYVHQVEQLNRENRRRYFRKEPKTYSRNLGKIASGLWLEHAFGWVPLLHDIDDARKAYDDLFEIPRLIKVSAGGTDSHGQAMLVGSGLYISSSYLQHKTYIRIVDTQVVRYRAGVMAQAATTARDRAARFGFTPSEFIPTAWELLPWSFLADYFANIGDILSASVTDTSNVSWTNASYVSKVVKVVRRSLDREAILASLGTRKCLSLHGSPGVLVAKKSYVSRSPVVNVPLPSLYFTYPTSDKRLFNIAALLEQVGLNVHPQQPRRRNYRL